jgi:YjbE family integral membrane protein
MLIRSAACERRKGRGVGTSLLAGLLQVLVVNVVLSGDNAVVIGMAARTLPPRLQRRAILIGAIGAVALRLALTLPATFLLRLPMVRAGGGAVLAWVAYRLLAAESEPREAGAAASVATAVGMILVADVSMSLDNVLAVAAIAERSADSKLVLVGGLALSIPLVLLGGRLVTTLMNRLPLLAWVGGAVLAFTAAGLIVDDSGIRGMGVLAESVQLPFTILLTGLVLSLAGLVTRRRRSGAEATVDGGDG